MLPLDIARRILRCSNDFKIRYIICVIVMFVVTSKYFERIPDSCVNESMNDVNSSRIASPHWIVAVDINPNVCRQLVINLPEWTVLVVGGPYTECHGYSNHSRCRYLSNNDLQKKAKQWNLPYRLHASLAVAYLHAIKQGAKTIYVLDEESSSNATLTTVYRQLHKRGHRGVLSNVGLIFDSAAHFGCKTTAMNNDSGNYILCNDTNASIIAEARCRAMDQWKCDENMPSVTLQHRTFADVDLRRAIFMADAFWALPLTRERPAKHFTWQLGVQRLLWLIGRRLRVDRCRQVVQTKDTQSRKSTHYTTIAKWQCAASTFKQCIIDMLDHVSSPSLTRSWIDTLSQNGYNFADISPDVTEYTERNITLYASNQSSFFNLDKIRQLHSKTCANHSIVNVGVSQTWVKFDNVLLLIVFNNPLYYVIPYLELLYRPFFPTILYCGPKPLGDELPNGYAISFVSYGVTPNGHNQGSFNYRCMLLAAAAGYNVDGYLFAADDLLLNIHPLASFDRSAPWYLPEDEIRLGDLRKVRECKLVRCNSFWAWEIWTQYSKSAINALNNLQSSDDSKLRKCHSTLKTVNNGDLRANAGFADIYYVPRHLMADFVSIAEVFLRNEVYLEIGVPTTFVCLAPFKKTAPLQGTTLWHEGERRKQPWLFFKSKYISNKTHLHPTKWGHIVHKQEMKELYCGKVLPFLHDKLAKISG